MKCIVITAVYVCLSFAAFLHYCTYTDVTLENVRGCPLVVHHWAHFQPVHGFRCYGNIRTEFEMSAWMDVRTVAGCLLVVHCANVLSIECWHDGVATAAMTLFWW